MSTGTSEIQTYFGRCRCCLQYGYLKDMWEEHYCENVMEIYVEMLVECFALTWVHSEESKANDQICTFCIKKLRIAHNFKKVVLKSQDKLLGHTYEETVKIEKSDCSVDYNTEEEGFIPEVHIEDPDDPEFVDPEAEEYKDEDNLDPTDVDYLDETNESSDMDYQEIEYLEDEECKEPAGDEPPKMTRRTKTPAKVLPDRKWPRKLPKSERYKTYKQYTQEDLRKCLNAVKNEEMTPHEAAEMYNIPKKTLIAKIKMESQEPHDDPNKKENKEKMFKLIQELKTILTYTNATPYKSKSNKYFCIYCTTDSPQFDDPDVLRTHVRTKHASERAHKIEYAMRPYWINETVKLDVHNFICNVCCIPIPTWNDMFKHFKDEHEITLDQAYTRVIPYTLAEDLKCALCYEDFTNYLHLDGHMNAHYRNYMCCDCGDTFLSGNRLKQHMKIHDVGKFPCSMCPKVFSLRKYKKKHEELVHNKHLAKFKCYYCDEKFTSEYMRHLHLNDFHKEKVKIIKCEFCEKTFTWRPYYSKHKRKKHEADIKYLSGLEPEETLTEAPKKLTSDMFQRPGETNFTCNLCEKKYVYWKSLKQHLKSHAEAIPVTTN